MELQSDSEICSTFYRSNSSTFRICSKSEKVQNLPLYGEVKSVASPRRVDIYSIGDRWSAHRRVATQPDNTFNIKAGVFLPGNIFGRSKQKPTYSSLKYFSKNANINVIL